MMTTYKLTNTNNIIRDGNASIPTDPANSDYQQYMVWLTEGNTPEPADPPTQAEITNIYVTELEAHYDTVAQVKHYDNRFTCALRAGYAGPFQTEGQSFAQWMDLCNLYAYQEMGRVQAGERPAPTHEELVAELPVAPW